MKCEFCSHPIFGGVHEIGYSAELRSDTKDIFDLYYDRCNSKHGLKLAVISIKECDNNNQLIDDIVEGLNELNNKNMVDQKTFPIIKPCDSTCGKCGSGDIYRRFLQIDKSISNYKEDLRENEFIKADKWYVTAKKDCIHNHCRCCGYDWECEPL